MMKISDSAFLKTAVNPDVGMKTKPARISRTRFGGLSSELFETPPDRRPDCSRIRNDSLHLLRCILIRIAALSNLVQIQAICSRLEEFGRTPMIRAWNRIYLYLALIVVLILSIR